MTSIKKGDVNTKELLKELTSICGAPGFEHAVAAKIESMLSKYGNVQRDRLGSILIEREGPKNGPRVMLAAHMDEVAFMVKGVLECGLIKFIPLGGWWSHVLPAQRVVILGNRGEIPGVVGAMPPHHLSAADREKLMPLKSMVIDVGADNARMVAALGIEAGMPIIPDVEWRQMGDPDVISSKALDDRIGVAMMIEIMRRVKKLPNTLIAVGTTQEEIGVRGAKTAVSIARPDVAIILEGPPADDLPGVAEFVQGAMGKGPQLRSYDPTMITNPRLFNLFKDRATSLKLPFQVAVREAGGTDASVIHVHAEGVPSIVIGVPVRYAHSHVGLASMKDFEVAVQLVVDVVQNLDSRAVKSLFT
ncbi:MAG: M42 family metallopeptidase [Candidatus Riflebacteria bacterium]|nr:M42 family metallopeptidase [Candidatus Riflebacteria bacterium]